MDKPTAFSPFPKRDKTSWSRIIFSAIVFSSIVVNCFVPRFFIGALNPEFFSNVLKTQTIVFEYFSFAALPLDIVNSLFSQNKASADPAKARPASGKKTAGSSHSEFNFISVEKVQNALRALNSAFLCEAAFSTVPLYSVKLADNSLDPPRGAFACMVGVFLTCFFLLPRSSTNDAAIILANRTGYYTRFDRSNRVFLLYGKNAPVSKDLIYFPDGREDGAFPAGAYHEIH